MTGVLSRIAPGPRRRASLWWGAALLLVLVSAASAAFVLTRSTSPEDNSPVAVPVAVTSAQVRDIIQTSRVSGTLSADISLNLTVKVPAQIVAVPAQLGQRVKAGDVLLRLSTSDLDPQLKGALAALTAARSSLARLERGASWEELEQVRSVVWQAQTGWDAAVKTYERMSFLYREGAISLQQFEASEAQVKVAAAQLATAQLQYQRLSQGADAETLAAARAQVMQAEAAYEAVAARVADAVLRAPVSGVISYVRASTGDMAAPGVPVIGLVDIDQVYLEAGVTEGLIGLIRKGQDVLAEVPATGKTYAAVVAGVAPAADARTRLFQVRIEIPNPDGEIKPGMLGQVQLLRDRADGVLTVPREALLGVAGSEHVYVVIDGKAVRRDVLTGLADDSWVHIRDGLDTGEKVVTTGAGFLRDGSPVNVIREDAGG